MAEDIFADVEQEGETQLELDTGETTSSDTGTEKKQEVNKSNDKLQEGEKAPELPDKKERWRWMQMRKANRELKDTLAKQSAEIEAIKQARQEQSKGAEVPQDWIKKYGDTPESRQAYQDYLKNTQEIAQQIEKNILEKIQNSQKTDIQGKQQADEFINSELNDMEAEGLISLEETEIDGKKQQPEVNKLMKFILDYQKEFGQKGLLDDKDNYDLRKALKLMQRLQPESMTDNTETKKKIASDTMKSKGSPRISDIPKVSRGALRRGNWRDAI